MSFEYCNNWLNSWSSIDKPRKGFGFENFLQVVQNLGYGKLAKSVVLVAGTNGKGSCVRALEALAIKDSKSVLSFTSPHISDLTERFVLNGKKISYELLAKHLREVLSLEKIYYKFSFFEILTLVCFSLAKESYLDLLILEVGLGGRFDCTNTIDHDCAVITSIGYDHQYVLGDSLAEIAYQKAGIIKEKKPIICGTKDQLSIIKKIADDKKAKLIIAGLRDYNNPCIHSSNLDAARLCFEELFGSREWFADVLSFLRVPGRFEKVSLFDKTVIFDVAHNVPAIKELVKRLKTNGYNKIDVCCNFSKDKDIKSCLYDLMPIVNDWYFFIKDNSRLLDVDGLVYNAKVLNIKNFKIVKSFNEINFLNLLVCGSFVVVSEARYHSD